MILTDMHTHSDNSPDGENSVIELCESAVSQGLQMLAITDHCEIDLYDKDNYDLALRQALFDIMKARSVFGRQLEILRGIELGNALSDPDKAQKVVERFPYDFVLGSLHHPIGVEDFAFLDYKELDAPALLEQYYDEMEQLVDWGNFDVLSHLTYPLRYINGIHKMGVDIRRYKEKLEIILKKAIEKGKGIEINTSGLRQPYGFTMPDLWCLTLYRQLGGEILTLGSDAHCAADIGANISDAQNLALEAGFRHFCVYRERRPVFLPLGVGA